MQHFKQKIKEVLNNTNAHSVFYGKKMVNGVYNGEYAIIHMVTKKRPVEELPDEMVIPKEYNINGQIYKTDVIEKPTLKAQQCYPLGDPSIVFLNTRIRPLSGGLEIANLATFTGDSIYVGTLGLIAVDNVDGTLVGVTNLHVAITDGFYSSDKDPNSQTWTIVDKINVPNIGTVDQAILQFGSADNWVYQNNYIQNTIGAPKRYMPLTDNYNPTDPNTKENTIDAAIFALNAGNTDSSSASIAELANSYALPFATTQELDSLAFDFNVVSEVYSVGRTTGPRGPNCPLQVFGYGATTVSGYKKQGVGTFVDFIDVFFCEFKDSSNLPSYEGDSGSAVIGNFNGTYKILGLLFAGDSDPNNPTSTFFTFCRIDYIAANLNIAAWDGLYSNFKSASPDNASKIYRPLLDDRVSITYQGKTYWQCGIEETSTDYTSV